MGVESAPNAQSATPIEWRFAFLRWSLASQQIVDGWLFPPSPIAGFPGRFSLLRAARWRLLLPGVCCLWAGRNFSSSRYITGALLIAIGMPFLHAFCFNLLRKAIGSLCLDSRSNLRIILHKSIEPVLLLALRTVVGAASGHHNPTNRRLAVPAGLAGPLVDPVFQLEEAAHPVRIHIVGNRRASQPDGLLQNFAQGEPQPFQLCPAQPSCPAPGPQSGAKQALVSIDVAHSREQSLVEQGGLDGQSAPVKQGHKIFPPNAKRLRTRSREAFAAAEVAKLQPAEPARIDETQLPSASQSEARMSMRGHGAFGRGHQEPPGHAQMHNPLRLDAAVTLFHRPRGPQFANYVLAGAMNGQDDPSLQPQGLSPCGRLEGLRMGAEPDFCNPVSAYARVDPASDRLDFRQFGHPLIVEDKAPSSAYAGFASG